MENTKKLEVVENTKYYIPTIEEFHSGFEHEYYSNSLKKWFPTIFDIKSVYSIDGYIGYDNGVTLKQFLMYNKYRVKYLDRKDIEELGFIKDIIRTKLSEHIGFWIIKDIYYGTYDTINNLLQVIDLTQETKRQQIFKGTIKNKSELRKLIKQIING